ncbi:DUF3320 domain-containing protein [Pseudokineococcus basanitobsidens]|uniref:DUF3320 domain-containing protein n=1 Tax=Pseudokineococcus basanitobsidens TaxID=1926649 RepID=A0ABU8RF45_9ACTN
MDDTSTAKIGDGARVRLTVGPRRLLSYAMAHNRVQVVPTLVLRNDGPQLRGATLRLQLLDAEGPIGVPHDVVVDVPAGESAVYRDLRMTLDPAAMLQVEEQRPGVVRASVLVDGVEVGSGEGRVQVLAAHQWLLRSTQSGVEQLSLEMLAAHVMPNHPAIAPLLSEVADRLAASTGSPSVQGYQAGAERVDEIVRCVWEAMQARSIRYSEPPPSWSDRGQKVRTPGEVLEGRVGTCLDTVVVMAAALEHAGIKPLLFLVQGHIFLGYWREERSLGTAAQTEVDDVVNLVDLGAVGLVETTLLTAREEPVPFARSHRPPYAEYLTGDLGKVLGVTDVHQARRDGVLPLPARTRADDGTVTVTTYSPAAHSTSPAAAARARTDEVVHDSRGRTVPPRVAQWKNALLDLSLRNRLINFTDRARLQLAVPDAHLGALEDAVHEGTAIQLLPSDHVAAIHAERGISFGRDLPQDQLADLLLGKHALFADATSARYDATLRGLAHKARTITEETGANNLYLALGSLVWTLEARQLRSPLVLVPVSLRASGRGGAYRLVLDESGMSTPNFCLLEKLRQVHGLEIPDLAEPASDGAGIDLDAALTAVRTAVAGKGLPFRVEPTADLAILQFAKFRLWKDLDENWEALTGNALVRHLVSTPTEPFTDPIPHPGEVDLDELAARCPVPADSSQLAAVGDAVAGRTFVLEGPPGTGKSQTITNLLTRAVADGKRVLFVAEKRAALDVVSRRLHDVGMGAFCLDLHDKASRPTQVREQIRRALDLAVEADRTGLSADLEDLRSSRRALVRYARRLHEPNGAGLSLYGAEDARLALGGVSARLPVPEEVAANASAETAARVRRALADLPDVADLAHPTPEHPWAFVDPPAGSAPDVDAVHAAARDLDACLVDLPADGPLAEAVRAARTPGDLVALTGVLGPAPSLEVLDETRTDRWREAAGGLAGDLAAFLAASHPGLDSATPAALHLPLADIHADAQAAAASGFFGRKKRLRVALARLEPALRPGAEVAPKQVPELTGALLHVQGVVRGLAGRAGTIPGLVVPPQWNPLTEEGRGLVDRQVEWLRWAGTQVDTGRGTSGFVGALRRLVAAGGGADAGSASAVRRVSTAVSRLAATTGASPEALDAWAGDGCLLPRWQQTAGARAVTPPGLTSLRRWLALHEQLEPLRAAGLPAARSALLRGEVDADDAARAFDLGLAEASAAERRRSTGLDAFDGRAHERAVERFTRSSSAVREHLTSALPEQVLATRTLDPSASRGQMGLLQRQLTRRRGGMTVRELMRSFHGIITQLMPCVLVSPDSVARFFPAEQDLFDVVVFDEASQVRVADAVGAMGRGRSVVVVGDSKQMPPTSFAESSLADDDTEVAEDVVEDEESILSECVQAGVPQQWLSWHYRSQDESLIAFSNRQYYDDKLSSFPAPVHGASDSGPGGHGVSLVRVDGTFHRSGKGKLLRTNPAEAEALVAEIRRRFAASPDEAPSLGVVTFNQQQRAHVEALLRDDEDPRLGEALDAPEGLFVKNLENVQGDERDVVFFSTAFSKNDKGVLPLNFGPLNRAGGERRLNVAVTRARRQVVVFSSFAPSELRAEETTSRGIKDLRAYLDLAERGAEALPGDAARRIVVDRHREEVADALRGRGYVVRTDVGLSSFTIDLSVARADAPDVPVLAVLLDGPAWAQRRTTGDRDGLPRDVLSRMLRWPAVERVWLPAWLDDAGVVVDRLVAAVDGADVAGPEIAPASPVGVPAPRAELGSPEEDDLPSPPPGRDEVPAVRSSLAAPGPGLGEEWRDTFADASGSLFDDPRYLSGADAPAGRRDADAEVRDFVPWAPRSLGDVATLDALPRPDATREVRRALQDVVDAEGPVHVDRLARLVAGAFGLGRVSESRKAAVLTALPPKLVVDDAEPVVWPASLDPATWRGYRPTPAGVDRPVEHLPLREVVNAMADVCRSAGGMTEEELLREALAVFGGRRLTAGIRERMVKGLVLGLSDGRLRRDGEVLVSR